MSDDDVINPLLAHMREGELLLWTGKPNPDCYFTQRKKQVMPFFVGGALLLWICSLVSFVMNGFASPAILAFVIGLIPLLMLVVSSKNRVAPKWWYAVTDRRVLSDYPTEDAEMIWQLSLVHIHKMSLKKHNGTVGTIQFNFSFLHQNCVPFECVEDAEAVYTMIEDARHLSGFSASS